MFIVLPRPTRLPQGFVSTRIALLPYRILNAYYVTGSTLHFGDTVG